MSLTKKQSQILNFIIEFIDENSYSPSYQEIADNFKLSSKATVHEHVKALQEQGLLTSDGSAVRNLIPSKKDSIEENEIHESRLQNKKWSNAIELPLSGLITAGEPIEAVEGQETITVPSNFVMDPANSYVLRVKGESMIDEGILNNDHVIVERNPSPRNGDVVVALLNNQYATLKKFYREDKRIRLQPANKTMKPIYVKDPLIQGIVRAVIRKYATI